MVGLQLVELFSEGLEGMISRWRVGFEALKAHLCFQLPDLDVSSQLLL